MPQDTKGTQGPKNATGSVTLTAYEKRAVVGVAAGKGVTESDVLRDYTIAQIIERFERIQEAAQD